MESQHPEIFRRITQYIGEYLETDVSALTPDSRLATAVPGLDSLKLVELILYLEEKFEVELETDVIGTIDHMKDLAEYIDSRLVTKTTDA